MTSIVALFTHTGMVAGPGTAVGKLGFERLSTRLRVRGWGFWAGSVGLARFTG